MPLPLIPILLGGASVLIGGIGAAGISVEKDRIKDAQNRIEKAKSKYEDKKSKLEQEKRSFDDVLSTLGRTREEIKASFQRFADAFEKIHNRPEFREVGKERFKFTSLELRNIRQVSISALEVISNLGTAAIGSGLTVSGAWGLVGLLGSASTGTALNSLAGAVATKATLAWFGGGSLAAGGLGVAGGLAVLGGLALGPGVLISALHLSGKADEALAQASKAEREVDSAVEKIDKIILFSYNVKRLAQSLLHELKKAQALYETKVSQLENLVARCNDYNFFSEGDKLLLDNNIMLVKVLMDMARADLIVKDAKGEPIMESDAIRDREIYSLIDDSERSLREVAA